MSRVGGYSALALQEVDLDVSPREAQQDGVQQAPLSPPSRATGGRASPLEAPFSLPPPGAAQPDSTTSSVDGDEMHALVEHASRREGKGLRWRRRRRPIDTAATPGPPRPRRRTA